MDHFCVDCSADGDVRRLFACSTINRGNVLTPTQINFFRAGHAHADVLTLISLLYYVFLDQNVGYWQIVLKKSF